MPISMALPIASLFSLTGCLGQASLKTDTDTAVEPGLPDADCLVSNETDLTWSPDQECVIDPETEECFGDEVASEMEDIYRRSLRSMVELYNNGGGCPVPSEADDDGIYDQAIYFMTDEWDSSNDYSDHVDETIILNERFTFEGGSRDSDGECIGGEDACKNTGTVVIGNWNSQTTPATENDYGNVTIDATAFGPFTPIAYPCDAEGDGYASEDECSAIFVCGPSQATGSVTLRNLTINVCSGSLLADGALFDGTYSCLVDGGAVTVVPVSDCEL